jgi:hypothetical protein
MTPNDRITVTERSDDGSRSGLIRAGAMEFP